MTRWDPWRALRARRHIDLHFDELADKAGGGIYATDGENSVIVLSPELSRRQRRAILAHELVHDERHGGAARKGQPESWRPVVARDEAVVNRTVAERLVPRAELAEVLDGLVDVLGGVTAADVAEIFDVPDDVARLALTMLADERRNTA